MEGARKRHSVVGNDSHCRESLRKAGFAHFRRAACVETAFVVYGRSIMPRGILMSYSILVTRCYNASQQLLRLDVFDNKLKPIRVGEAYGQLGTCPFRENSASG